MTSSNLNTRRHFLGHGGLGIGAMALSSLLARDLTASSGNARRQGNTRHLSIHGWRAVASGVVRL
ncbi:MAG TPA: twin-arginine translocation signal domain-containing protein [Fuerstia sp.]|nr:twin-arginine translocation signal domain-containing protein [Fuerstiella sp.]